MLLKIIIQAALVTFAGASVTRQNCSGVTVGHSYCAEQHYGRGPATTHKPTKTTTKPTSAVPSPTQSGLTKSCTKYYKVVSGDTCQTIVKKFSISSLQQFYAWNPAVGSSCQTLFAGYYVCVAAPGTPVTSSGPSPTQSGIVQDCTKYYKAVKGDTCNSIVTKFGTFTIQQFESWNPAVGSTCAQLLAGYYYCVAVPGTPTTPITTSTPTTTNSGPQPQESGTISSCTNYYLVQAGDECDTIEQQFNITPAQFFSWNTGIQTNCSNLWAGYYVCVGV